MQVSPDGGLLQSSTVADSVLSQAPAAPCACLHAFRPALPPLGMVMGPFLKSSQCWQACCRMARDTPCQAGSVHAGLGVKHRRSAGSLHGSLPGRRCCPWVRSAGTPQSSGLSSRGEWSWAPAMRRRSSSALRTARKSRCRARTSSLRSAARSRSLRTCRCAAQSLDDRLLACQYGSRQFHAQLTACTCVPQSAPTSSSEGTDLRSATLTASLRAPPWRARQPAPQCLHLNRLHARLRGTC